MAPMEEEVHSHIELPSKQQWNFGKSEASATHTLPNIEFCWAYLIFSE